jgi:hypothetical protein
MAPRTKEFEGSGTTETPNATWLPLPKPGLELYIARVRELPMSPIRVLAVEGVLGVEVHPLGGTGVLPGPYRVSIAVKSKKN